MMCYKLKQDARPKLKKAGFIVILGVLALFGMEMIGYWSTVLLDIKLHNVPTEFGYQHVFAYGALGMLFSMLFGLIGGVVYVLGAELVEWFVNLFEPCE